MSNVPKSKRGENKLTVIIKAKDLYAYFLEITANEGVFEVNKKALTEDILHTAQNIYINCFIGNKTYVNSKESYYRRWTFQQNAIAGCEKLVALINLAYSIFKLRYKRIKYMVGITLDEKDLITKWRDFDKERYKEFWQ